MGYIILDFSPTLVPYVGETHENQLQSTQVEELLHNGLHQPHRT